MLIDQSSCLLATTSQQRRVEYRQRTVFLRWDRLDVRLEPDAFACLNRLLATGVMELELFHFCEGDFRLEQHRPGHFKLQLGAHPCLALPLLDFLTLVQLVRLASRRLPREAKRTVQSITGSRGTIKCGCAISL
ncbi:MAG: hypothetical protein KDF65_12550 [Anaerolineae bacterium]|nr:hypothetical protein [Anaerolineae bacterium]